MVIGEHCVSYADPIGSRLYAVTGSDISGAMMTEFNPYALDSRVLQETNKERGARFELMNQTMILGRQNTL